MQIRKYATLLLVLVFGLVVGWYVGARIAYEKNERYIEQLRKDARHAQAKERALLAQLLDKEEIPKAKEMLYIFLSGNFKDYRDATTESERAQACELKARLGDEAIAS
jgi:hypothetical protein